MLGLRQREGLILVCFATYAAIYACTNRVQIKHKILSGPNGTTLQPFCTEINDYTSCSVVGNQAQNG